MCGADLSNLDEEDQNDKSEASPKKLPGKSRRAEANSALEKLSLP